MSGMVPRSLLVVLSVIAVLAAAAPAQAIVGGSPTTGGTGAYPWQVAVITSQDQEQWLCGGTLVAGDLVLTAAHCVIGDDGRIALPGQVKVLSGNTNIDNTTFSQAIDVGLYPGLDLSRSVPSGDLAIVHLPIAAPGGAPLPVVGAAESSLWDVGARLRITGWGVTSAGSTRPTTLLAAGSSNPGKNSPQEMTTPAFPWAKALPSPCQSQPVTAGSIDRPSSIMYSRPRTFPSFT